MVILLDTSMNTGDPHNGANKARQTAINGLAIVGFVALVFGGIMLAIYGAKFVPETISRLSSAVYLSSDEETPTEPEAPIEEEPADEPIVSPNPPTAPEEPETAAPPSTGGPLIVQQPRYYYTYGTPRLYGLPDLRVSITEVGYLRTSSTSSFREDNEVPDGKRAAFKFVVRNVGTNASGQWRFRAELPTKDSDDDEFVSPYQEGLMPGASKTFTLGFDNPDPGNNRSIEIEVDENNRVAESNERNNTDSETIDVKN